MPRIDKIDRRTDAIFILFNYADNIAGVTKLQKLMFLVEMETEFFEAYKDQISFEFKPYKMGPFSQDIYDEIEFMIELDAVKTDEMDVTGDDHARADLSNRIFKLTERGEKIASQLAELLEPKYQDELRDFVQVYNSMPLSDLLEYVYQEYPEYTSESEIIDEVLH